MSGSAVTDTIVAVATATGRGAVGIVRLSGPDAAAIAERIAGSLPAPRQAALRHFADADGERVDHGLLLYFPAPASFTGEDVIELQGHGGPMVMDVLLRSCCHHGARIARPGEFSERAFVNGRLDLAQAEAIADLIDAGTRDAARAALRSLDGELSGRVAALADALTAVRVFVEGALDFSDEEIDWLADRELQQRIERLRRDLGALLADVGRGRRLREGLTVALTGQPNVGKSTLMNRLTGTDVAIVTEIAGTTRDPLRENLDLDGLPVTIVDTAGLRDSDDPVEREGVRRARAALAQAEVALYLIDDRHGRSADDDRLLADLPDGLRRIVVHNKCDLSGHAIERRERDGQPHLYLSAADGRGIELLVAELRSLAGLVGDSHSLFSARSRHVRALELTRTHLETAIEHLGSGATAELAAEELRLAQDAVGEITGRVSSDDLLGHIFSSFCIGK